MTAILGSKYPIIQGAMGVICNPELVAAVSEAGGFGLLATAFSMEPDPVRNNVRATKQLTNKPFGANLVDGQRPGYRGAGTLRAPGGGVHGRWFAPRPGVHQR